MKTSCFSLILSLALWLQPFLNPLSAAEPIATVTKYFGKANVLSPSDKGDAGKVIFEDKHYSLEPVKVGSKFFDGSVVQTGEKSMVRLVFDNGDQVMVSALSSYKISSERAKNGVEKPVSDLLYGKFRAVISKEGPRNNMEVRTRTMVMGIRGTDFYVASSDESGASVVSVLRGAVAVASKPASDSAAEPAKPVEIAAGFSARIAEPQAKSEVPAAPVKIDRTDKIDLQQIQESVSFKAGSPQATAEDPLLVKRLAELEEKALVSTKKDIKASDPDLYKRIEAAESEGKKIENVETLQNVTIEKALVYAPEPSAAKREASEKSDPKAPKLPPVPKPTPDQLKEMEGDIYDKYFKE